jgi:hypothetical protein
MLEFLEQILYTMRGFSLISKLGSLRFERKALDFVTKLIEAEYKALNPPKVPRITASVCAPLKSNAPSIVESVNRAFSKHFGSHVVEMEITIASEDFSAFQGSHDIPYTYWNFGGSSDTAGEDNIPKNHSPFFAPKIQPTLQTGADAMALAVLVFLA